MTIKIYLGPVGGHYSSASNVIFNRTHVTVEGRKKSSFRLLIDGKLVISYIFVNNFKLIVFSGIFQHDNAQIVI